MLVQEEVRGKRMTFYPDASGVVSFLPVFTSFVNGTLSQVIKHHVLNVKMQRMSGNLPLLHTNTYGFSPLPLVWYICGLSLVT